MNVKLGKKMDSGVISCSPSNNKPDEIYYPSAYIEFPPGEGVDIPESGRITFVYRLSRESREMYRKNGEDPKKRVCVDLELRAIKGVVSSNKEKKEKSTAKVMDEAFGKSGSMHDEDVDEDDYE